MISGEKIQEMCDYYIGKDRDFNYNPRIKVQKEKFICIENFDIKTIQTLEISKVFCYTHILVFKLKSLKTILNNIKTKFELYFHNSDSNFEKENLSLLDIENITKIYTQNINVPITKKIMPLPIGIANSMWKHGNINIWNNVLIKKVEKSSNIYFNFNINTNKSKRNLCYNIIKSKNIPFVSNTNYENYLEILGKYKFCICPEGNGLDTHRFWECLYLKVIPICLKNKITEYYSTFFPIILLDKWEDLDVNLLVDFYSNDKWNNYELLFLNNVKNILNIEI
tara:strand:- start:143 stop:985 length:843 start_codon:yes stop_codon:yes gene_type:complete